MRSKKPHIKKKGIDGKEQRKGPNGKMYIGLMPCQTNQIS